MASIESLNFVDKKLRNIRKNSDHLEDQGVLNIILSVDKENNPRLSRKKIIRSNYKEIKGIQRSLIFYTK